MRMLTVTVALAAATIGCAPVAQAEMGQGNYELLSNRWTDVSWVWAIRTCTGDSCLLVRAIARPAYKSFAYRGDARFADGRYTLDVDVPDGLRCPGAALPSHDTYRWDAASLSGWVDSSYQTDCTGGPGGTDSYPFSLVRM